jgi:hypothetical protein
VTTPPRISVAMFDPRFVMSKKVSIRLGAERVGVVRVGVDATEGVLSENVREDFIVMR